MSDVLHVLRVFFGLTLTVLLFCLWVSIILTMFVLFIVYLSIMLPYVIFAFMFRPEAPGQMIQSLIWWFNKLLSLTKFLLSIPAPFFDRPA
jgi:hypothetical protein